MLKQDMPQARLAKLVQLAEPWHANEAERVMIAAADEIERLRSVIAKAATASLEWSTGVRSATEACAEMTSALMHAAKM